MGDVWLVKLLPIYSWRHQQTLPTKLPTGNGTPTEDSIDLVFYYGNIGIRRLLPNHSESYRYDAQRDLIYFQIVQWHPQYILIYWDGNLVWQQEHNIVQLPLCAFYKQCLELIGLPTLEGPGQGSAPGQLLLPDELLPQLHRALPLLLRRLPAQPNPDPEGSSRYKESVVAVEVVFREISLLQLLSLHCSSDVTDPINIWYKM